MQEEEPEEPDTNPQGLLHVLGMRPGAPVPTDISNLPFKAVVIEADNEVNLPHPRLLCFRVLMVAFFGMKLHVREH